MAEFDINEVPAEFLLILRRGFVDQEAPKPVLDYGRIARCRRLIPAPRNLHKFAPSRSKLKRFRPEI